MKTTLGLDQDLINAVSQIVEASCSSKKMEKEEFHPNQVKLDKNKNGKLDADDFKKLRKEESEDLEESLAGKAKHLVKGIKRLAAGKPSAAASEKDADTKGRQRYADSEVHHQAAKDAIGGRGPNTRNVIANRMSAGKYNMEKGKHQFRRADRIAALRDKVRNEELYLEDYTLEEIEDFMMSEDFEQLDELSKSTTQSYLDKAFKDHSKSMNAYDKAKTSDTREKHNTNIVKRSKGIASAMKRDAADQLNKTGSYFEPKHIRGSNQEVQNIAKNRKNVKEELYLEDYTLEEIEDFMMSEDFEQLDEISKKVIGSYVKKASNDLASSVHGERDAEQDDEHDAQEYHAKRAEKRMSGLERAGNKLAKEEVEPIDELSKKTLSSYIKTATGDLAHTSELRGAGSAQMAAGKPNKDIPDDNTLYNKQGKRIRGMFKAVNKLTKEQVEEIEALAAKHGLGE